MKKQCPWCNDTAVAGCWTPRFGWIDLCQRHYNEISREVIASLLSAVTR